MTQLNEGPIAGEKRPWIETLNAVSDQGRQYLDATDSKCNKYYGFLSQIEGESDGDSSEYANQTILFDIVPKEWMETAVLNAPWTKNEKLLNQLLPQRPPASFLQIEKEKTSDILQWLTPTEKELAETDWFMLELGNEGINASRWIAASWNLRDDRYILEPESESKSWTTKVKGEKLSSSLQELLRKLFSAKGRLDRSKLDRSIAPKDQSKGVNFAVQGGKIGVMDVGQASCNLIYDSTDRPLFYFDVGCPKALYGASAPPGPGGLISPIINPGPCLGNGRVSAIILSHWHDDHYNMAVSLRALVWVMPTQPMGPNAIGLFQSIPPGNRIVWPRGLSMAFGDIQIIGCTPAPGIPARDINNSGLAVAISIGPANTRFALLPGDASFQSIPYAPPGPIVWMTAPHHGSRTHLVPARIPVAVGIQTRIAISYGIMPTGRHPYGHPSPAAINAYRINNSILEVTAENTPNSGNPPQGPRGNIMMCNNVLIQPFQPCNIANCPFHTFPKTLI